MKIKRFIVAVIFFLLATGHELLSQSFEGVITYKVEFSFEGKLKPMQDQLISKMKSDGEYYDTMRLHIKGGKYLKQFNNEAQEKIIYNPSTNKIYYFAQGRKLVPVRNAQDITVAWLKIGEPQIFQIDTSRTIGGMRCLGIKVEYDGAGAEIYFYNNNVARIMPSQFELHKWESLNIILEYTKAYPLQIVKGMSGVGGGTMTMVSIESKELSEDLFSIPKLKRWKRADQMSKSIAGCEMFKIVK